jgi:type IV secretion system protein VirB6
MTRYVLSFILFVGIALGGLTPQLPSLSDPSTLPNTNETAHPTRFWFASPSAHAATPPADDAAGASNNDTCVSDLKEQTPEDENDGLITQVIDYIKEIIDDTSEQLFNGIVGNSGFKAAVNAAFALAIAFFGVAFMFGIVPFTFGQALTRGLKIAIIAALIGGGGWSFFSEYAVTFFNDGTDDLIGKVISIATGEPHTPGDPKPFSQLEKVVLDTLSPEMMIANITSFITGPQGIAMGGLLSIGIMAFVQMLVKAMRVYVISLVAKALLFGLAPIFISFILFERTKNIFTGWINQLVNYSLQPLLLFAFLSFFVVLIESSVKNILSTDICWVPVQHYSGATTTTKFWSFVGPDGKPTNSEMTWDGLASCIEAGGAGAQCDDFPISIIDILTFLILSHLAYRFSDVVVNLATEIASSTLFLDKLRSGMSEIISDTRKNTTT